MTKLKRNYYLESKEVTYEFIKTCVHSLQEHIIQLMEKEDSITLERMKKYVTESIEGLNNLKETYQNNVNMEAKLKCQIEKLELLNDKICNLNC